MWCVLFNILVSSSTLVLTTHWTVVTPLWLFSNFNEGNLMKSVTIAKCENECIPLARAPVTPPLWPRPLRSRSPDPTVGAYLASYINPPSSLVAVKITFSTALTAAVSHIKKIGRCLCVRYVINRYRSDLARSLMSRSEHISIRIVSRILRKKDERSVAVTFRPFDPWKVGLGSRRRRYPTSPRPTFPDASWENWKNTAALKWLPASLLELSHDSWWC